jgi:hypothetical protein
MNFARPAAATATPENPKIPAIIATIRNIKAQFNMTGAFHWNNARTRWAGVLPFKARQVPILHCSIAATVEAIFCLSRRRRFFPTLKIPARVDAPAFGAKSRAARGPQPNPIKQYLHLFLMTIDLLSGLNRRMLSGYLTRRSPLGSGCTNCKSRVLDPRLHSAASA